MSVVSGEDLLVPSSDSFWEVEGYRRTVRRVEDGTQQCAELMKLVQERADIEKEYAKRLKAWAKKWNENFDKGPEYGTNKSTLKGCLDEAEHVADIHLTVKDRLINDVQSKIKDWKNDNYKKQMVGGCKEAKTFEEEFRKAQKPWSKRLAKVVKAKKEYHLACKLERTAINQENNARNSSDVSADQVKKLQEKVEKCQRDVESCRERYQQSLSELNSCNAKYIEDMTEVFQRTQEFELKRLQFYKKLLYDLHSTLDLTQYKTMPEIFAQLRHTIDSHDAGHDLKLWSQFHGVDMAMAWPTFEEYSPELTDIARKKFSDAPDAGTVTLRRITTSKYNEEFVATHSAAEYSADVHNVTNRDNARSTVTMDNARLTVVQHHTQQDPVPNISRDSQNAFSSHDVPAASTNSSSLNQNPFGADSDWDSLYANSADITKATTVVASVGGVRVRALFDYVGQEDDELSFRAGEIFIKTKDCDDQGWCTGCKDGRVGLYPDNYVERISQ